MSSPVSKKPEEKKVVKKVYKIGIRFYDEGSAMIIRKDLPALIDKTDNSVRWLYDHGVPLKRICVLTFTNKAAGELRDRLERRA